jgi:ferric-dicitrate binding protein FerR (iron transport regulator)
MNEPSDRGDMIVDDDVELLTRYLNEQLDPERVAIVRRRLQEDSAFLNWAAPLVLAWKLPTESERRRRPPGEIEKHWDRFTKEAGFVHQRRKTRNRYLGGLAMIIGILGVSALLLRNEIHDRYVDRRDYDVVARGPRTIVLREGIQATVATGSVLRQAKHPPFANLEMVKVQGSVRFDVTHLLTPSVPQPGLRVLIVSVPGGQVSTSSADFSVVTRGDSTDVQVFQRQAAPAPQDMFSIIPDFVHVKRTAQALPQLALREGELGRLVRDKDPVRLGSRAAVTTTVPAAVPPVAKTAPKTAVKTAPKTALKSAVTTVPRDTAAWIDLANAIRALPAPGASLRATGFTHDSILQTVTLQGEARFIVPPMKIDLTGLNPPKGIAVSTSGANLVCNGGDFTVTMHGDTTDIVVAERHVTANLTVQVPMPEYVLVFLADAPAPKRVMSGERARVVRGELTKLPEP